MRLRTLLFCATSLAVATLAPGQNAQGGLLVDIGPSGQSLQTGGYVAYTAPASAQISPGGATPVAIGSQIFNSVDLGNGVLQNVTLGFQTTGNGHYNSTAGGGFGNVTNGTGGSFDSLLDDGYFGRGNITLTITGLAAGNYQLITSDRGDALSIGTIGFSKVDANGTTTGSYSQPGTGSAADAGYNFVTYSLKSNGSNPITITLTAGPYTGGGGAGGTGPDNAVVNGLTLTAVPEPDAAALMFCGSMFGWLLLRRARE